MRAAWYETAGPAREVLHVGRMPDPEPGPGEVRVRVAFSGVNPGDTKKRSAWTGGALPYPRVIPHSDGSGVIDALGDGVDARRLGGRVWVRGAQSYRAFGTAAELVVVPEAFAVDLPEGVPDELGAVLGIPGITAHRALFADGPVAGSTVLVQGVLGAVSSVAAQLARRAGARVIGTVRRREDVEAAHGSIADHVVVLGQDAAAQILQIAPEGVDRIIEVSLSANADLDESVSRVGTVIAAFATGEERTAIPFWPMLFKNVVIRLLGSDDFPARAVDEAARDLTAATADGALQVPIAPPLPLERIAEAHGLVDAGSRSRIVLDLRG